MKKKSKLMIYIQADLAPEAIRWAIRLSLGAPSFCNACIAHAIENMERGLKVGRKIPPIAWTLVKTWQLRQGKPAEMDLPATTIQRAQAQQQAEYRQAQGKIKIFEQQFLAGTANLRIVFQVQEGPETGKDAERWPLKLRRMAEHFQIKPNELVNRMVAAGISALEREDPSYEPDFVSQFQREAIIPRIEQLCSERLLADRFDTHADVPPELVSDGWAFMSLNETANLHYRELVDGLLEGKSAEEALSSISRDHTLSPEYLSQLRAIYADPTYQDWSEEHPLRDKKLKKEVINALVDQWRRIENLASSEQLIIQEIKSRLPGLSEASLRAIQKEIKAVILSRSSQ